MFQLLNPIVIGFENWVSGLQFVVEVIKAVVNHTELVVDVVKPTLDATEIQLYGGYSAFEMFQSIFYFFKAIIHR